MGHPSVRMALATVGLSLVLAACGTGSPASIESAAVSSATSPAPVQPASNLTPSPAFAPTPAPIVVAAASLEPALKQLWQVGGPKPRKDGAGCVTVAPEGTIWAAAEYDSAFWIMDANGKYLESWGAPGSGDGEFDFVTRTDGWGAIAFDPDGTFYVADAANHRVQKFDKDRRFVKAWGSFGTDDGQFATPIDIASDGRGSVYVLDNERKDVQQFSSDGAYIRTVAAGLRDYLIDTDPDGRLYVDNGSTVLVFDADGRQLPGIDLSSSGALASGMAFDADGHMYVAMVSSYDTPILTKAIYEIDASGTVLHAWPGKADSIALDPKGAALYSSFYIDPFIRKLELPKR